MEIADEIDALADSLRRLGDRLRETAEAAPKAAPSNRKKLTAYDVGTIRGMWSTGNYTITELADEFDVHRVTIRRIIDGVYWKE